MRITSKGQVTIPAEIREQAGLLPYTEVEFDYDGKSVILRPAARGQRRGKLLVDHMRGRATAGLSTEEIMALTRGPT